MDLDIKETGEMISLMAWENTSGPMAAVTTANGRIILCMVKGKCSMPMDALIKVNLTKM